MRTRGELLTELRRRREAGKATVKSFTWACDTVVEMLPDKAAGLKDNPSNTRNAASGLLGIPNPVIYLADTIASHVVSLGVGDAYWSEQFLEAIEPNSDLSPRDRSVDALAAGQPTSPLYLWAETDQQQRMAGRYRAAVSTGLSDPDDEPLPLSDETYPVGQQLMDAAKGGRWAEALGMNAMYADEGRNKLSTSLPVRGGRGVGDGPAGSP